MKDVNIINNEGGVDPVSPVKVSKSANEEVTWHSKVDHDATVSFDGGVTPFAKSAYLVPAGKSVHSGPPVVPASPTTGYKYTVIGFDGSNDPVVIVDN